MGAFKTGLVEFLLVGVLGVVVGFGVNAARSRGSIKPNKNYFAVAPSKPASATPAESRGGATSEHVLGGVSDRAATAAGEYPAGGDTPPVDAHAGDHPYRVLSPDQVVEIFNDPDTASGLNVFIDARNDTAFEDGHIPGAVQFFPYEADRFLDDVLMRTNGVLRVIVYCNGGDCTDSKFACRELLEAGVPEDAVYLFAEGWEAWTSKNLPVATGRDEPS